MSADAGLQVTGLATADVAAALVELAAAPDRVYHDAGAADGYYHGARSSNAPTRWRVRTRTGRRTSRRGELYPWVDLQPSEMLRSLSAGHQ